MPDSIIKYSEIPRQMATKEEVEQVGSIKEIGDSSSTAAVVSNFIVNLMLSSSLGLIWGMINAL